MRGHVGKDIGTSRMQLDSRLTVPPRLLSLTAASTNHNTCRYSGLDAMSYLNSPSDLAAVFPRPAAGALTSTVLSTARASLFAEDVRTLKAAWFYSDEVRLLPFGLLYYARTPLAMLDQSEHELVTAVRNVVGARASDDKAVGWNGRPPLTPSEQAEIREFIEVGLSASKTTLLDGDQLPRAAMVLLTGNWEAALLGVPAMDELTLNTLHEDLDEHVEVGYSTRFGRRLLLPPGHAVGSRRATREGVLSIQLLASLPAFPDADWDVLSDVRDRMGAPLKRFRAAVVQASQDLEELPDAELPAAVDAFRRTTVEPGLADIDAMLDDLGALPTLCRLVSSAKGATTTAILALAASGAVSARAASVGVGPLGATATSELLHRREVRARAALHPMWLLQELPNTLSNA